MEQSRVIQFLSQKRDFLFEKNECKEELVNALVNVSDDFWPTLNKFPLRSPSLIQVLAIVPGSIDRLLLGDFVKCILKNFTLGGFGIWWVKDILSAKSRCREYNCKRLLKALNDPSVAKNMIAMDEKARMALQITKEVAPSIIKGAGNIRDTFYVN